MRETYRGVPTRPSAFDPLPDEVLQQILYFISPHDLLSNIHLVSKRFSRLGNESLLWRHHCRVDFQYWDGKHRIREKFAGAAGNVDWKGIYIHRMKVDLKTAKYLDRILETRANRIVNFEEIGKFGYDAKDTLLRHCHTRSDDSDQLSRT
jgi:F-box protein 21